MGAMDALQATVEKACAKRNAARSKKNYAVADELRDMLTDMGVVIQDTSPTTSSWTWSKAAQLEGTSSEEEEEAQPEDEESESGEDDDDEEEDEDESEEEEAAPVPPTKKRAAEAPAEEPFKKKRKEMRGGVVATILKPGKGAAAAPKRRVTMKYAGTLASNGKQFDAGKITFKLGAGEVIKGWDVGCAGMQVGERRQLFIPSKMAYGARGAPPDIPKHADLNFDCVLLKA